MVIQTLRPNAMAGRGAWTGNTGETTNLHNKVNDNSDTTFIVGGIGYPKGGAIIAFAMGNMTTPSANQRIMRVQCRIRGSNDGTTTGMQTISFGPKALVSQAAPNADVAQYGTTTIATRSGRWHTTDPDGHPWVYQRVNDVLYAIRSYIDTHGNNTFARVTECYMDVDVHTQVTASAVTVTDYTTTAQPNVSWTYDSNTDNDAQVAYRVRIFSAAQYGDPKFNPDTSVATWDSTQVLSNTNSARVETNLVNNTTFKAYVQVASDFNGAPWVSPWVASSAFATAYPIVPKPTLTVTADNTLPSLRNLLTADSKMNMLTGPDASFEDSGVAALGTWVAVTNCAVSGVATQAQCGGFSMRMTATAAADMSASTTAGAFRYQVFPGTSYTAFASFRANSTGRSCRVKLAWYDGAGALISTSTGGNVSDTNAGWTQANVTGTSPANAQGVVVIAEVLAAGAGEAHFVDCASLSTSTSLTWYTGGLQKADTFGFQPANVVNIEYTDFAIPGEAPINRATAQLATGGEVTRNADGWFVRTAEDRVLFDQTELVDGDGSIRWDVGETTASFLDIGAATGTLDNWVVAVVPGRTYTFTMYVKAKTGSHTVRTFLYPITQTGAQVGTGTEANSGNQTVTTAWSRLTVTITPSAGAIAVRMGLENTNGDLTSYYMDNLQVEECAYGTGGVIVGGYPGWFDLGGIGPAHDALSTTFNVALQYCHEFLDHRWDWLAIEGGDGSRLDDLEDWVNAGAGRRLVISVPLLPGESDGSGAPWSHADAYDFAGLAAGDHDAHFESLATKLQARPGLRNTIVRLGWEFNGNSWPWSPSNVPGGNIAQAVTDFKAGWNQVASSMRAIAPSLQFEWCPAIGYDALSGYTFSTLYPGDTQVDYIGIGAYDYALGLTGLTAQQRWDTNLTKPNGFNDLVTFRNAHPTKRLARTEWGLWPASYSGQEGGGDSPFYIQQTVQWMINNGVAYSVYNNASPHDLASFTNAKVAAQSWFPLMAGGQLAATPWRLPQSMLAPLLVWQPVRGALTALREDVRNNLAIIWDREAAPGGVRMYRAHNVVTLADGTVTTSDWSTYVPSQLDTPGRGVHVLKDLGGSALDLAVNVTQLTWRIDEDFTESHPARPNDPLPFGQRPLVVTDWTSGDNGQATIVTKTEEDWYRLKQLLRPGRTLLLQFPEGGHKYVRPLGRAWPQRRLPQTSDCANPRVTQYVRHVVVDFAEVSRPAVTS